MAVTRHTEVTCHSSARRMRALRRRERRRMSAGVFILPEAGRNFGVARSLADSVLEGAGEKEFRKSVRAVWCGSDRTRVV
jgi:hypothetical protein